VSLDAFDRDRIMTADEGRAVVRRLLGLTEASVKQTAQLEHALRSRVVIEQAKGILAERFELDLDDAFQTLRRAARTNRVRLADLAREVIERRPETPDSIERVRSV